MGLSWEDTELEQASLKNPQRKPANTALQGTTQTTLLLTAFVAAYFYPSWWDNPCPSITWAKKAYISVLFLYTFVEKLTQPPDLWSYRRRGAFLCAKVQSFSAGLLYLFGSKLTILVTFSPSFWALWLRWGPILFSYLVAFVGHSFLANILLRGDYSCLYHLSPGLWKQWHFWASLPVLALGVLFFSSRGNEQPQRVYLPSFNCPILAGSQVSNSVEISWIDF